MLKLPGYETLEKIHEGGKTLVYRAIAREDERPVIFKTINSRYPTPVEITRLKREYEITARFNNQGVSRVLELVSVANSPVIILEDFGGTALANFLGQGPLEISEFLPLAVRLASILGDVHSRNVIHKGVNPSNIVWNRERDILKIIDFGISLELSREVTGIKNPNVLEGALAYISPEQTGRMNRFLDYRTDYYSLGVTFYQMLAGRLPFESRDAMEMVYAHIARPAPVLHELDGNIPRALSGIVQKLMAKNVEDRYQSARGLVADLKRCLEEFLRTGSISEFTPGTEDVSDRFQIPQKLYGRDDEIAALLSAFGRASLGERELMLVSGLPGIGKSALVNEIQKPIVKLRGNFIAGKYDKFKMDVPYSALIQAFSGLVKHLLAENEERLENWKRKILGALGPNGRVITDVIPELELVIGAQADIPILGPDESRNRFNLYFQFFIGVFCKESHPLVLFLDDLQWADHASLEMMKLFLSDPDIKHLCVIGAFRSNEEVDAAHPLNLVLDEIRKTGTGVNSTAVASLRVEAIMELLSDSLHCAAESTDALAELLLRKTGGNPFFLGEFLKSLYQDDLLGFKPGSGWLWDVQKIEALQVTDNVVELMAAKIERLPGDCERLLKLGACLGNNFEMEALVEIAGKPAPEIRASLNILLEEGLLIKLERIYKFAHDRIQEAAYSLIPEDEAIREHRRIGGFELKKTNKDKLPQRVFFIVNQLNAARVLIDSDSERLELAELNLLAGTRARSSAAYRPALNYLDIALELLDTNSWKNQYELTLTLHQEAAGAAFLCGDYERMEGLANSVMQEARDVLDTVSVYETKIFAAMAQDQLLKAVQIGLMILGQLGVRLPENPGKVRMLLELLSVKWILWGKSIEHLENNPQLKEPRKLAITRILSGISTSTYIALPDLFPLITFYMVKLSIKYGNTEFAPYSAYASFGMVQCGVLGDIKAGVRFGQLALRLIDKLDMQGVRNRSLLVYQVFIRGWREHLRNTLQPLKDTLRLSMETGDPEFTCNAAYLYIDYAFICGRELGELEKESVRYKGIVAKQNQLFSLYALMMDHQLFLNLLGISKDPCTLKGDSYDIDVYLPIHLQARDHTSIFHAYFNSCFLNYIFEQYENALKYVDLAKPYSGSGMATFSIPLLNLYKSLSQLALYHTVGKSRQRKFIRTVTGNQKKMKNWARHAPMNFEHKYQLVEAEKARVLGRELKARDHYEAAIYGARENQYINEEALALELFAKFWLELGKEDIAGLYLNKARQAYGAWGALAKVKHLDNNYGQFMQSLSSHDAPGDGESAVAPSSKLDLATVVKASQTIAGEIILSRSLEKMMKIVMENAGAQAGFLILDAEGELYIEAAGSVGQDTVAVLQSESVKSSEHVPINLIQYVARSGETVVLEDALNDDKYSTDAYILKNNVASILCVPILNQGKLSGVLYLENNGATGVFTEDRVEVLRMLSSQIAVSIDNARLYANLEEKVKERTTQLENANTKLREMDQLKNNLFTNISHEIRTPLTLILSPLDNLIQNVPVKSDPAQAALLNTMAANGQRLLKQVNDMLDLAKFDADKMQLQYQFMDIVGFIREIALNFRPLAESKGINLKIIGDSPVFAALDPEKFEKGILNLLGNAFKFIESGEIRIHIRKGAFKVKNDANKDSLTISIRDTGPGIPPGQEEAIFQRFNRADNGDVQNKAGTGIGLALVREIINMHKGRVWVEPSKENDAGAEFILELPVGPDSGHVPAYESESNSPSPYMAALVGEGRRAEPLGKSDKLGDEVPCILVVEDNQDMRDYLVSILRSHFRVIQAENGVVGLELARKNMPGLILSDVMMPEMDGLELLSRLRNDEETKMTPIVMLSAKSELAEKLEGLVLGADDYIAKPFRPAELLLKIRNLLHKGSLLELERHKEREAIFADLHDYLGGSLTDMTIMVKRLKRLLGGESREPAEHMDQLEAIVKQAVLNYRQCFAKVEELNHLQGDFVDGLNLILLGRYSNFDREIDFQANKSIDLIFQDQRNNPLKKVLYALIMEIVTNDLKYGMGQSHWDLDLNEKNEFLLKFSASTDTSKVRKQAGRGTGNIQQRVKHSGGVVNVTAREGLYHLNMQIPFVNS